MVLERVGGGGDVFIGLFPVVSKREGKPALIHTHSSFSLGKVTGDKWTAIA
jgi:hypothetical protein